MSDWSSVYSGVGAANGGLDLEMPVGKFMTKEVLLPAIANGIVTEQTIDAKVCHILQTLMLFGAFDHPTPIVKVDQENEASKATALAVAREGIVLLKNQDNTLPFRKGRTLVLGPNADVIPTGGGSGFVTPHSTTSLYKGLVSLVGGKHVRLLSDSLLYKDISTDVYTDSRCVKRGFKARYYNSVNLSGSRMRPPSTMPGSTGHPSPACPMTNTLPVGQPYTARREAAPYSSNWPAMTDTGFS